jgi:N-methylhydantoinase A/oxoprolinase/acetone carboxylase beta subunit
VDPYGEIEPLDEDGPEEVVASLGWAEFEVVAVCLLFAFLSSVIYVKTFR